VSSPIVEDSSGNRSFKRATINALTQWKYNPAIENGQAIQQCNQSVRLDDSLDWTSKAGATKKFVRYYKAITALIGAGELVEAKASMARLKATPRWNLYQDAWLSYLQATYYIATADEHQQLISLNRVISGRQYIPNGIRQSALVNAFILNLKFFNYAHALAAFEKLEKPTMPKH